MTAATFPRADSSRSQEHGRVAPSVPRTKVRASHPPLSPRLQLARAALVLIFALSAALVLQLTVVSALQEHAAQGRAYNRFRAELANGTAPIGPTDEAGHELPLGPQTILIHEQKVGPPPEALTSGGVSPGQCVAVPIAEPESLATGGTNTSEKKLVSLHFVFQSQFSPHPPVISNGMPLFIFDLAN